MGASVMDVIGSFPRQQQAAEDAHQISQAQLPGVQAQSSMLGTQAQIAQQQLRDQTILSNAFRQVYGMPADQFDRAYGPSAPARPSGGRPDPFADVMTIAGRNGISAPGFFGAQTEHMNYLKNSVALDKEGLEALNLHKQVAGSALEAYDKLPDADKPAAWPQTYNQLSGLGLANGFDPNTPPTPAQIQMGYGGLNYTGTLLANAKQKQGIATAAAQEAQANATAAATQQETETKARTTALLDLTSATDPASYAQWQQRYPKVAKELPSTYSPDAIAAKLKTLVPVAQQPQYTLEQQFLGASPLDKHAAVDAVARDPQVRQMGYGLVDNARTPQDYTTALHTAAEKQAAIDLQTNPQVQKNRLQLSAAEGAAHAQTQMGMQERERAENEYIQSKADLDVSLSQAEQVKRLAAAAQAGDKVAAQRLVPALVQYANGLYGVKRQPNGQMMEPPGSWADKIQGWANGATAGVPLSSDILQQIPQTVDAMTQTARAIHNAKVRTTNQVRGTNFPLEQETAAPTGAASAPAARVQPGQEVTVRGKQYTVGVVHPDGSWDPK